MPVLFLALLASCAHAPLPPAPPSPAETRIPFDAKSVTALAIAGDDSVAAFDNAVDYFQDQLTSAGLPASQRHMLSATPRRPHSDGIATLANVLQAVSSMRPPPGGSCLIFMTSHGVPGRGLYLSRSQAVLQPAALDQALQSGCGNAPTVLIMSSCYSGVYAAAPMTRPNRIILTAAAADRTSFGCGTGFIYTYYDDCLLGSLDGAIDWHVVYDRTRGCVTARERQSGSARSEPQAVFGADAGNPGVPWRPGTGQGPGALLFQPSQDIYNPRYVPLSPADRPLMADELKYYATAPEPKALALAPIGLAIAVAQDRLHKRTEDDVARLALQRCEYLTGGACVLFARDNVTAKPPPVGLPLFHPMILVRQGPISAATVPFIRDDQRGEIADYIAAEGPKALALSPARTQIGIGKGDTLAEARKAALDHCRANLQDCVIYAENNTAVLGY